MKTRIFTLIAILLFISVNTAFAQSPTKPLNIRAEAYNRVDGTKEKVAGNLQTRSITEIDRRINALTKLLEKLSTIKFLTDAEKQTLTEKIQTEIDNLNELKANIQANTTDQQALKDDAKLVLSSHPTFAFFLPLVRILAGADSLMNAGNMLYDYAEKLEERITTAQQAGQTTTGLTTLLSNMRTDISQAQTLTANITASVSALSVDNYPDNRSTLQKALQDLKTAGKNLRSALKTGNEIRSSLADLEQPDAMSADSPSPAAQTAN